MNSEGEQEAPPSGGAVGDQLRAARQAEGLTLDDVAARTRIPVRHLVLIEDGVYEGLPAATYSAGFVKTYAGLLGLDSQALSDAFRREIGTAVVRQPRPEPYEPADPRRTPPLGLALLALLLALVAGVGFLYWRGSRDQPSALAARGPAPAAPGPAAPPAPSVPPPPAATDRAADGPVVIGASEEVWIKVASDGTTLFMGTLKPGDHYPVPADAVDPLLTTGRPGVTTISVGTTSIPPIGDPDRAAHNISLKPADLLARVSTPPPAVQPPAGSPTPVENAAGPF